MPIPTGVYLLLSTDVDAYFLGYDCSGGLILFIIQECKLFFHNTLLTSFFLRSSMDS